ncbi:MAG TPA: RNA-binding protein [Patescibacteria group bacterium]|jgi:RNA recognition motif-containing protein|nr:RNA-binding protein [Patescibacteria group bacterium]
MAYKLFIGSLSWNTDDAALQAAFAPFGTVVSATVVKDRNSGRSKGFGFVEFEDETEGKAAEAAMNGKELDGREIVVNEARPREDHPRRDFGGNGGGDRGGYHGGNGGGGDRGSFRKKSW